MNKRFFFSFTIILIFVSILNGNNLNNGEKRANLLFSKIDSIGKISYEKAFYFSKQALLICDSLENRVLKIEALQKSEKYASMLNNYEKSLKYNLMILVLLDERNDLNLLRDTYFRIGEIYFALQEYKSSLIYFKRAGNKNKLIGDSFFEFKLLSERAQVLRKKGKYEKALLNFEKAMSLIKNDFQKSTIILMQESYVYMDQKKYDKALKINEEILDTKKRGNSYVSYGLVYNNIGFIYREKKDFKKAIEYNLKAYKFRKQRKDKILSGEIDDGNSWHLIDAESSLRNIGDIYYEYKQHEKAIEYYLKALNDIPDKKSIFALNLIKDISLKLHDSYKKIGNIDRAYLFYKMFVATKDSISQRKNLKEISKLKIKYDILGTKKSNEILKQENKIKNLKFAEENKVKNLIIGFSILLLLLLLLLFKKYKNENKINKILIKEIRIKEEYARELKKYQEKLEYRFEEKQEELFSTTEKLRDEEIINKRLLLAISQINETIFITNLKKQVIYVNPAFEKMTGYMEKEVLHTIPNFFMNKGESKKSFNNLLEAVDTKQNWKGIIKIKRYDNSIFDASVAITPIKNKNDEILNFICILTDITESLKVKEKLNEIGRMETIATLAGGVAHDFNNIMTIIKLNADILLVSEKIGKDDMECLKDISDVVEKGAGLTSQLLSFAGKDMKKGKKIEISKFILETIPHLKMILGSNIKIEINIEPCNDIIGNENDLMKILENLCLNAQDFIDVFGVITISLKKVQLKELSSSLQLKFSGETGLVLLRVGDNGVGMDENIQKRIFDPFFSTKKVGEGHGLGLSVVYSLIKNMDSEIEVESNIGEGTNFYMYFKQYT